MIIIGIIIGVIAVFCYNAWVCKKLEKEINEFNKELAEDYKRLEESRAEIARMAQAPVIDPEVERRLRETLAAFTEEP